MLKRPNYAYRLIYKGSNP